MKYNRTILYIWGILFTIVVVAAVIDMDDSFEETQEIIYNIPHTSDLITAEEALNIALELRHLPKIWKTSLTLDTFPRQNFTEPTWSIEITYMPHSRTSMSGDFIDIMIDAVTGEILKTSSGSYESLRV